MKFFFALAASVGFALVGGVDIERASLMRSEAQDKTDGQAEDDAGATSFTVYLKNVNSGKYLKYSGTSLSMVTTAGESSKWTMTESGTKFTLVTGDASKKLRDNNNALELVNPAAHTGDWTKWEISSTIGGVEAAPGTVWIKGNFGSYLRDNSGTVQLNGGITSSTANPLKEWIIQYVPS